MFDWRIQEIIDNMDKRNGTKFLLHADDSNMTSTLEQLKIIEDQINFLLSRPQIKKYLTLLEGQRKLYNALTGLEKEKQDTCRHEVWYYWSGEAADMYDPTVWTCRCIECGFMKSDRPNRFNYVVRGKMNAGLPKRNLLSFEEVVSEYKELKRDCGNKEDHEDGEKDKDVVNKILILKLNPQKK